MHIVYNETAPATFFELFQKVCHPYPTGFSKSCYKLPKKILLNANTEFQAEDC